MERAKSRWWRYSRYEIEGGYIRPAAGASLETCDPWRVYGSQTGHVQQPPHLHLAMLVREVPPTCVGSHRFEVSEQLRNEITTWCTANGLLGLLPHTVLSSRLDCWHINRVGSEWVTTYESPDDHPGWLDEEEVTDLFGDGIEISGESSWKFYFPSGGGTKTGKDKGKPVVPLTDEFWRSYAEPLQYFIRVAKIFANAIEVISSGKAINESRAESLTRERAIQRLNQLANPVSPQAVAVRGKTFRREWVAPSLLAHLAMQAVEDLLGGRRTVQCPCGIMFSTTHTRATFHEEKCAARARKQRERARENPATRSGSKKRRAVRKSK